MAVSKKLLKPIVYILLNGQEKDARLAVTGTERQICNALETLIRLHFYDFPDLEFKVDSPDAGEQWRIESYLEDVFVAVEDDELLTSDFDFRTLLKGKLNNAKSPRSPKY